MTFTGCASAGFECNSAGAAAGEIVTKALEGQLGITKEFSGEPVKNKVGLSLFPVGKTGLFAEFMCGSIAFQLRGAVIVQVKTNKMLPSETLKYAESRGRQKLQQFVGGPKEILELSIAGSAFEQAGLTLETLLRFAEPIEVNTVV